MDREKFGAFIAELRKEKGWTQAELSEKLHVSAKTVSKWETGRGLPDIDMLEPLATQLKVSVSELFKGERSANEDGRSEKEAELLSGAAEINNYQRERDIRNIVILLMIILWVIFVITLIEDFTLFKLLTAVIPAVAAGVVVALAAVSPAGKHGKVYNGIMIAAAVILGIVLIYTTLL